mgnify:CR=1 FL=1
MGRWLGFQMQEGLPNHFASTFQWKASTNILSDEYVGERYTVRDRCAIYNTTESGMDI